MNKVVLGQYALGEYYLGMGDNLKAVEAFKNSTDHPGAWRQMGLAYADLEDLENSISAFSNAIKAKDTKSIPWLVDLLESHRPDDPNLEPTRRMLEKGIAEKNIDIIFSVGNLKLIAGEVKEAVNFWIDYIPEEHWIINRNLAREILDRFHQFGELIPAPFGPIDTAEKAAEFFLHVNEKGFADGEPDAFYELGTAYLVNPEPQIFANYSPRIFFDKYIELAKGGHPQSALAALYFAHSFEIPNLDDSELMEILREYGLLDVVQFIEYGVKVQNNMAAVGARWGAKQGPSATAVRVSELFEIAEAAAKRGDSVAELAAWLEGANLGDDNCFRNFGVALCNELGITLNFFGASGGEDKAWSRLAIGIGVDRDRPGRGPTHQLSRFLSSTQIEQVRAKYGAHPSVEPDALKPGQAESLIKICDLFEKCGYIYQVLDQNLIAIPYGSKFGSYLILCELINDEGKDMALIYACLLTSKFDQDGKPVLRPEGLNHAQEKVLDILVRDQELVFPTTLIELGTIFKSLPEGTSPESFINISKSKEFWSVIGGSRASMFFEVLPTKHEFEKLEFGYGIDISLQSDHFESGIRGIVGAITGMLELVSAMHAESEELFDLVFDYQPSTSFEYDKDLVPYDELAKKGSRTAQAREVYQETDHDKRLKKLVELSETGMHVATRVMLEAVDLTEKNIDTIAEWLLKEAAIEENSPQVRDYLNNIGWAYRTYGDDKKALPIFEKAARLGSGNALATLTWHLLATGEHEYARKVFDDSYYRIMITRETDNDFVQGSNIRSNDALHRFALGASHDELRAIWCDEYLQENHLESKFYPILLDHIEGNSAKVEEEISKLDERSKRELIETFKDLLKGSPWIAGIAKTCLELLPEEHQKKKGLFRR